jgi:hypothetical protein
MLLQKRTQAERKYIMGVFSQTIAIATVWLGLTGVALYAMSDRMSLTCDRDEESVPHCKLSATKLATETHIDLSNQEIQQVTSRAIANNYLPSFVQWQTEITTDRGKLTFSNYGIASSNPWENFTDRTNRFIDTPQLRSTIVTSEYSFWFKFILQAVSGVSLLYCLFLFPSLYLTAKYGNDPIAQQQAIERVFSRSSGTEVSKTTSDRSTN